MNRTSKKLLPTGSPHERRHPLQDGGVRLTTFVPLQFRKRGIKKVVVGPEGVGAPVATNASAVAIPPSQDNTLLKALALAYYWDKQINDGVVADASEIAQREQMEVTRVREVLRLVILDPKIAQAILGGPATSNTFARVVGAPKSPLGLARPAPDGTGRKSVAVTCQPHWRTKFRCSSVVQKVLDSWNCCA